MLLRSSLSLSTSKNIFTSRGPTACRLYCDANTKKRGILSNIRYIIGKIKNDTPSRYTRCHGCKGCYQCTPCINYDNKNNREALVYRCVCLCSLFIIGYGGYSQRKLFDQ